MRSIIALKLLNSVQHGARGGAIEYSDHITQGIIIMFLSYSDAFDICRNKRKTAISSERRKPYNHYSIDRHFTCVNSWTTSPGSADQALHIIWGRSRWTSVLRLCLSAQHSANIGSIAQARGFWYQHSRWVISFYIITLTSEPIAKERLP